MALKEAQLFKLGAGRHGFTAEGNDGAGDAANTGRKPNAAGDLQHAAEPAPAAGTPCLSLGRPCRFPLLRKGLSGRFGRLAKTEHLCLRQAARLAWMRSAEAVRAPVIASALASLALCICSLACWRTSCTCAREKPSACRAAACCVCVRPCCHCWSWALARLEPLLPGSDVQG